VPLSGFLRVMLMMLVKAHAATALRVKIVVFSEGDLV